jgi:transposase-like protein
VRQLRAETGERFGAVKRVADQLGYGVESVRSWVHQADIDDGVRPGTTTDETARIKKLEQENRELRRANEILRRASAFLQGCGRRDSNREADPLRRYTATRRLRAASPTLRIMLPKIGPWSGSRMYQYSLPDSPRGLKYAV